MVLTHNEVQEWLQTVEKLRQQVLSKEDDAKRSQVTKEWYLVLEVLELTTPRLQSLANELLITGYTEGPIFTRAASKLSTRELEAAQLVSKGLKNKEIAEAMSLGVQSVKNLLGSVMQKLDCRNRTEIAVKLLGGQ